MRDGKEVAITAYFADRGRGEKIVSTTAKDTWSSLLFLFYGNKTNEVDTMDDWCCSYTKCQWNVHVHTCMVYS
jgi:hypothetical protein